MIIYTILALGGLAISIATNFYLKSKNTILGIGVCRLEDENAILSDKLTLANRQLADHGMASYLVNGIDGKDALRKQFEKETGKHAIWGGKETKQFKEWAAKQ